MENEPQPGQPAEPQQAPDRAEEKRVDVPQNEVPVETENLDTGDPSSDGEGSVEGTRNESLPTENSDVGQPDADVNVDVNVNTEGNDA